MKIVRISNLAVRDGTFVLSCLMIGEDGGTYYKDRYISDSFALKLLKAEKNTGSLVSRFSKSYKIRQ